MSARSACGARTTWRGWPVMVFRQQDTSAVVTYAPVRNRRPGAVPQISRLVEGEVAVNIPDRVVYVRLPGARLGAARCDEGASEVRIGDALIDTDTGRLVIRLDGGAFTEAEPAREG